LGKKASLANRKIVSRPKKRTAKRYLKYLGWINLEIPGYFEIPRSLKSLNLGNPRILDISGSLKSDNKIEFIR